MEIVTQTDIKEYPLLQRGKVRDIYELSDDELLIVTTDRMSAFDVIMAEPIPFKGVVLNQVTLFWMEHFRKMTPNHLVESDVAKFPKGLAPYASQLEGRSVIVKQAKPLPIECIVRGHITGSGWKDYLGTGLVCGHELPKGLQESEKLATPLFTPSTKAELGEHDENITLDTAKTMLGENLLAQVEELSLRLFTAGREYAEQRGIIIADTKFEFGLIGGELVLIDEVLTPDSSRFWPMQGYTPGKSQPSFDKQYLRDYLSTLDWNKQPPPPALPPEIVAQTGKRYVEAFEILTKTQFG
ncbi:MAG: phosphoribosylaminoimidazolesuccinocarboxamide synthase [Desulfovibrio sp.]|nr:MAG: phosphoribosylaminoimidazolesuccinocarboxamide synthase [Desulfovibrio sp.]